MRLPQHINPEAVNAINGFVDELMHLCSDKMHSLYLVGSALTADYQHKVSDINTLLLLREIDFSLLKALWSLGSRHRKRNIAAPTCLTPEYIKDSLDVFPMEFLDFKLLHLCLEGEDMLQDLEIGREHLRLQCEREIKSRLIHMRQGFISSLGDQKDMLRIITESITGSAVLFRSALYLLGLPTPLTKSEVFQSIQDQMGKDDDVFNRMLLLKQGRLKLSKDGYERLFVDYYHSIERLGNLLNSL